MGIDNQIRKNATLDIIQLLESKTSIEIINYKMLVRYGFSPTSVSNIIKVIEEGVKASIKGGRGGKGVEETKK